MQTSDTKHHQAPKLEPDQFPSRSERGAAIHYCREPSTSSLFRKGRELSNQVFSLLHTGIFFCTTPIVAKGTSRCTVCE